MTNNNFKRCNVIRFSGAIFLPALAFILIMSLISCGTRGDPVFVSPVEETFVKKGADDSGERAAKQDMIITEQGQVDSMEKMVSRPDAPKGLIAAYTGVAVVITWDEIIGQGVRMYRIYRMEEETNIIVGESVTPAFTDKSIEANRVYNYRISAVGISEGPTSEKITVFTEKR